MFAQGLRSGDAFAMAENILVIGAGASGLTAAHHLTKQGFPVTVIEARDRIGGRIHTLNNIFSIPVEGGAEFMHGKQPRTLSLIERAGTHPVLLSGNRYQIWNGSRQKGSFFNDDWDLLLQTLGRLDRDVDMQSFLDEHFPRDKYREMRQRVKSFVEGYDAADMRRVSAIALRTEWSQSDDEHQYRIAGGYGRLMQFLEEDIRSAGGTVVFSSPVREIEWARGKVKLTTDSGTVFHGDKVVITVPLGVLQNADIRFSPPLTGHKEAFAQMGFGGVIKVFMEFGHAFWEDRIDHPLKNVGFIFSDAGIPTWWSHLPNPAPLLTGWLGGPSIKTISHDPDALRGKAISALQYLFGFPAAEIEKEVRTWHTLNWAGDAYSQGAYAYPTVRTSQALAFVNTPVENTLFFAGEAFYEGPAMGTVEAALTNGKAVAEHVAGNPQAGS